jgi:acyl carrier protein
MPAKLAITYESALECVRSSIVSISDGKISAAEVTEESRLFFEEGVDAPALGIDSLDALDVITLVERELNIHFPDEIDFEHLKTVRDVAQLVISLN